MRVILNAEQLENLIRFAEDDRLAPDLEAVEALNILHEAVQRGVVKHLSGAMKRNASLTDRLERYKERQKQKIINGEFKDTEIESTLVAKALLYQLQRRRTYQFTQKKFVGILYLMYASWLFHHKERLFREQPVAREFGPQFYKVWTKVNIDKPATWADFKALQDTDPGRAVFCENAAEKYYDDKESEILGPVMRSQAYRNAGKENNGGKWNKVIEDTDIYLWRESLEPNRPNG